MKKLVSFLLSVSLAISMFTTTAIAAENDGSRYILEETEDDGYVVVGVSSATKESEEVDSQIISLDMEYLIAHSTNVTRSGSEYSGSYSSPKYSTGFLGYEYNINFEWEAEVDSDSNYYFKNYDIIEPYITTYANPLLLSIAWSSYGYDIIKNTYKVSNDGYSVTFYTNYKFSVIAHNTYNTQTLIQNNTKTILLEELL